MKTTIRETALTWDHETHTLFVDTTERGMVTKFKKIGLVLITKSGSYWRLKGNDEKFRICVKRRTNPKNRPIYRVFKAQV
jgi:hypothetical protein